MTSSPTTTGAVAVSAAMIAAIVQWLAGLAHLSMPPEVSGAIAALVLWAAHVIAAEIKHARGAPEKPTEVPK